MEIKNINNKWEVLEIKETGFCLIKFYPSGITLAVFIDTYENSLEWNLRNFYHIPRTAKKQRDKKITKKLKDLGFEWRFEPELVKKTISNYREFLNTYIKRDYIKWSELHHVI